MNSKFIAHRCKIVLTTSTKTWLPWSTLVRFDFVPKCVCFHTASAWPADQLKRNVKDCYKALHVDPENSGIEEVKEAFLRLAKEYHPDSVSSKADVRKFNHIQEAYQVIRSDLEAKNLGVKTEDKEKLEFDIQHTAPQHRQYLEFEGIGTGTPLQRHKQYQTFRTQQAMAAVSEHQIEKLMVDKEADALVSLDKKAAKQIRTTNVIDRLVEDLIKDAMNKGEFENLSNSGKPLPDKTRICPYWDINDHNLNQVLVNNGYAPEWIQAEREIKSDLQDLRDNLLKARLKLGSEPLNHFNQEKWELLKENFTVRLQKLNKNIERRNLIVPLLRLQLVHLRPKKEINKVMKEYQELQRISYRINKSHNAANEHGSQFKPDKNFWARLEDKIVQKLFFPEKEGT